jgi:hypothetical protein
MSVESLDNDAIKARLQCATSILEIAEVLRIPTYPEALKGIAKDPLIRKTVLTLCSLPIEQGPAESASRWWCLGALASVKGIAPVVDELSSRLTSSAPPEPEFFSNGERKHLASWLSTRKASWVPNYAAKAALLETGNDDVRDLFLKTVFSKSKTVTAALELIAQTAGSLNLCSSGRSDLFETLNAVFAEAGKAKCPPGPQPSEGVTACIAALTGADVSNTRIPHPETALRIAGLVAVWAGKSPNSLLDPGMLDLFQTLERKWITGTDKKWTKSKRTLVPAVEQLLVTTALHRNGSPVCIEWLRFLDSAKDALQKTLKALLSYWEIRDEDTVSQLNALATGVPLTDKPESRSNLEAIATVLIRAGELESTVLPAGIPEAALRVSENLLIEIRQLGKRSSLETDFPAGELIPFDPIRQQAVGDIRGGLVRVVVPGVIRRTSDARTLQIIRTIVEPA